MSHFGGYLPIILTNSNQRLPMAVLLKGDHLCTSNVNLSTRIYCLSKAHLQKKNNVNIIITKLKDCLVRGNVSPLDSMQESLSISFLLEVTNPWLK